MDPFQQVLVLLGHASTGAKPLGEGRGAQPPLTFKESQAYAYYI